ncbi:hypothetical protein STRCR_0292 [Streptococcus criceti HS-6]|uniref:Uncharacterized protein n=1 Tax=Streptococcus criceti HS-6 TaxID=873449 RepID=G5JP59_STRCG|nr:hypothetical protein STRCR_0292 [Streptococcus criceti HS-6]
MNVVHLFADLALWQNENANSGSLVLKHLMNCTGARLLGLATTAPKVYYKTGRLDEFLPSLEFNWHDSSEIC